MGTDAIEAGETPFDSYTSSFEKQNILSSHNQEQSKKERGETSKNERQTSKNKGETNKNEGRNCWFVPKSENK
ncbi:hypothetical protein ES332_D10G128900v1 [Gossypium tomentosum]|uniref:Uncharacterized protein n=1 Tax=Gossypium tomentosum TaxID=34277 RepID=A0A5D2J2Z3_GOSTO|nr:hypothetical protein ES332_D10G128900v1 [Gossypium tomentosum]